MFPRLIYLIFNIYYHSWLCSQISFYNTDFFAFSRISGLHSTAISPWKARIVCGDFILKFHPPVKIFGERVFVLELSFLKLNRCQDKLC